VTADNTYEELADLAQTGHLEPIEGTALHGAAAAEAGHRLLMGATGTSTAEDALRVALGRPRLSSAGRGPSPIWRIRASEEMDARVAEAARQSGLTRSQFVRDAVEDYLNRSAA
jgi:hypothetical protein